MDTTPKKAGFIRLIILIVIVLIILSALGYDPRKILDNPAVAGAINLIKNLFIWLWSVLKVLIVPLFSLVAKGWQWLVGFLESIKR